MTSKSRILLPLYLKLQQKTQHWDMLCLYFKTSISFKIANYVFATSIPNLKYL